MSEPPDRQKVIEKYLQGLRHDDGYSHGYLKSDEELKLFERSLAAVNESSPGTDLFRSNVVFSMIHCGSRISLDNVPFRVVKENVKVCIFGTKYYKKTQEKKKEQSSSTADWQKEVYEKEQVNLQGTKKKGCAAAMNLKLIELYPAFQVDVPQPCGQTREGRLKADKVKELQEALDAEQQTMAKETRVYVRIADCSSHQNHGFEDMEAFSQNVDKSVAERIQMLAREGITSVSDVKKCLHYYVHDVLFANKEKPDSSSRAFFPTHRDISNQIQAVLKKDRFSTVDQENARILIEKIRGEQPESSVVYRPYAARSFVDSSDSDNVEEDVASECEDTLLFCFQTKFMRSMLKNWLFIIQFETAHCITEAFDVSKQWCDNWSPQYWMVDYSKAQISAIKQVFPESQISICDFHRLQAWQRWLRRKENNISNPDEALRLMKHVASASNQHDFDKVVEVLVDSEYWKNERFRSYFEEVWLSVKELWVMSYRLEFDVVLTTNNGIEAQNRVLKAQYVKSSSGKWS
ncbi:hypothetical protein MRX96_001103 [Rhipicephalus microplus]